MRGSRRGLLKQFQGWGTVYVDKLEKLHVFLSLEQRMFLGELIEVFKMLKIIDIVGWGLRGNILKHTEWLWYGTQIQLFKMELEMFVKGKYFLRQRKQKKGEINIIFAQTKYPLTPFSHNCLSPYTFNNSYSIPRLIRDGKYMLGIANDTHILWTNNKVNICSWFHR